MVRIVRAIASLAAAWRDRWSEREANCVPREVEGVEAGAGAV
jgi:hypothetical protein